MNYTEFELAFWHPFGPHAGESQSEIIDRKQREIGANGWTLWSFQYRRSLGEWYRRISNATSGNILVFCSEGKYAKDPKGNSTLKVGPECSSYRKISDDEFRPIPADIHVPHPFMPGKSVASAFVVGQVMWLQGGPFQGPAIEWLAVNPIEWRSGPIPTRGEYLIRPGGSHAMRKAVAILELKPPYLAEVRI